MYDYMSARKIYTLQKENSALSLQWIWSPSGEPRMRCRVPRRAPGRHLLAKFSHQSTYGDVFERKPHMDAVRTRKTQLELRIEPGTMEMLDALHYSKHTLHK